MPIRGPTQIAESNFTASGWTREYTVHTLSPITRMKKDKPIQSGKALVTCVVSIPGVGTHSGSGEEWADDENAMTSAEAQSFKRACSVSVSAAGSITSPRCGWITMNTGDARNSTCRVGAAGERRGRMFRTDQPGSDWQRGWPCTTRPTRCQCHQQDRGMSRDLGRSSTATFWAL